MNFNDIKHSPLPWSLCNLEENKMCKCLTISAPNHPVLKFEVGKWGDDYPDLEIKKDDDEVCGRITITPVMKQYTYGEISKELAEANARYAYIAVNNFKKALELLQKAPQTKEVLEFLLNFDKIEKKEMPCLL